MSVRPKNTREVAEELLKTRFNTFVEDALIDFIETGRSEDRYLENALHFILEDGFGITGFGLFEIPTRKVYCFADASRRRFDIYFYGKPTAGFVCGNDELFTKTITEAIEGYKEFNDFD